MAVTARSLVSTTNRVPRPVAPAAARRPPAPRARLMVVPTLRRRRAASVAILVFGLLCSLMLGSAALSTNLAPRQVQIDQLDRQIRAERERYGELRRVRAELRSPARLMNEAAALGMVPATRTSFLEIEPAVIAEVQRATGSIEVATVAGADQEFDRLGSVKRTVGLEP